MIHPTLQRLAKQHSLFETDSILAIGQIQNPIRNAECGNEAAEIEYARVDSYATIFRLEELLFLARIIICRVFIAE